jgi:hypothetical protein
MGREPFEPFGPCRPDLLFGEIIKQRELLFFSVVPYKFFL